METRWVVVAESSRARIFEMEGSGAPLRELSDLLNPEARAHERDLVSDRQGRAFDSKGHARHAMEPETSPGKRSAQDFAHELAERIETARARGQFERLLLLAAPEFLGMLRKNLSHQTRQLIEREIHKNCVREDESAIRRHMET